MNMAMIGLIFSALLPIVCSWISGYFRVKELGTLDNKRPREQCGELTGTGARAVFAQKNSWEAFVVYCAAMLALLLTATDPALYAKVILIYIASRLIYVASYLANLDALRSLAFGASYGSCIYIMFSVL